MPVDPRMFAPADIAGAYHRGVQFRQQQDQYKNKQRLRDLLPAAMGYPGENAPLPRSYEQADDGWKNAYDEARQDDPSVGSFGDFMHLQQRARQRGVAGIGANPPGYDTRADRDAAMAEIASIDPEMFMKLDERQRKQASEELDGVVGAVRWADTPEKWQQVQQYYGQHGHDVSGYDFANREGYLLQLGKMGEYLKGNQQERQPSSVQEYEYAKGQGYDGSYMDFNESKRGPIVANNGDGTFTIIPRGMGGGQQQPAPPPPGFVIDGGPAGQQPGGFRPGPGF